MVQTKVVFDNNAYYHTYEYKALQELKRHGKMHGARRVVMFCLLTAVLPTILLVIPLYLRHSVYADVTYAVAESDVLEINDGISTVFCQAHSLKMNSSFHAFQLEGMPELSPNRKHIRLKKSMMLPDDTLEYWGFYLLKGSSVVLSVCSRFEGSRVMVVKGERNLRTCGLLEHKKEGYLQTHMAPGQPQVRVTFETNAQEIRSQSPTIKRTIHTTTERAKDEEFEGENQSNENFGFDNLTVLEQIVQDYVNKHFTSEVISLNETDSSNFNSSMELPTPHHLRHEKRKMQEFEASDHKKNPNEKRQNRTKKQKRRKNKKNETESDLKGEGVVRSRRSVYLSQTHLLDGGIEHGGNAANGTVVENDAESSFSSFENSLRMCYEGQILLNEEFPPSHNCTDVSALEIQGTMEAVHEVSEDGYYYYIFYSDNDYVSNDIHAIFNIHKPTFQYAKHARSCLNETECTFPITFWSDETVIVEIPTRDGIEHEEDDITYLISTCHPRMSVYIIFPVAVLFLILGCAFM